MVICAKCYILEGTKGFKQMERVTKEQKMQSPAAF